MMRLVRNVRGVLFLTVYLFSPWRRTWETVTETALSKLGIREGWISLLWG